GANPRWKADKSKLNPQSARRYGCNRYEKRMPVSVTQIKKLRGRSLREIRLRSRQEIAKLNERLLGFGTDEMSDAELIREIGSLPSHGTGEGIGALILERIRAALSPELS